MPGGNTTADVLYPEKMIDPLKPMLTLPEVVDPSKWKRGKLWFIDPEEKFVLRVFASLEHILHINHDHVNADEIRSAKDLLNPKWRGKISAEDPTTTGSGAAKASLFYRQFGEEFFKKLYIDQKPVFSRGRRQLADWLARGTYPICLNCRDNDVAPLRKEGFKISEIYELSDVQGTMNAQPWLLAIASKAPHPNAARLFANWMASKEGLEIYSRGYGAATLRRDIDESFLKPESIPKPGVTYFDDSEWQWLVTGSNEMRQRIAKLLKSR
jgi:iron(III) transport system substrate-binding protein